MVSSRIYLIARPDDKNRLIYVRTRDSETVYIIEGELTARPTGKLDA